MAKADKAAMLAREKEIIEEIAKGTRGGEICEKLAQKHGVTAKSIQFQYYRILKNMQETTEKARGEIRAQLMARADHIYQRALNNNNLRLALSANEQIAKLAGLDEKIDQPQEKPKVLVLSERVVNALPPTTDEQNEG